MSLKEINQNKSFCFGVLSDIHYEDSGICPKRRNGFKSALQCFKANNANLIILNGDIVNTGGASGYKHLLDDISTVFPNEATRPEFIFTAHSHEYFDAWPFAEHCNKTYDEVKERFKNCLNLDSVNTHKKFGGYHFIGVSSDGFIGNSYEILYSNDTLKWVENELNEASNDTPNAPIFLAIHQPPQNTVALSANETAVFNEIFEKYPQLIVFCGHSHLPLADERAIYQGKYTVINSSSCYFAGVGSYANYSGTIGCTEDKYQDYAQGLLVTVEDGVTDIYRCDFHSNKEIKTKWTVYAPFLCREPMYTEKRKTLRKKPYFLENTRLDAKFLENGCILLAFNAAFCEDFVHHYIVNIYSTEGQKIKSYKYTNFFFMGLDALKDKFQIEISALKKDEYYKIELIACDSFDIESNPIVLNL